ncbi:hypothetical protein [Staphylococcus warneri]|uniref:hypothetical protein n=1 Tax=Staphylococcus warneri TaxID=1292 RepID=UPI001FB2C30B|nr:hypothetical protein [Staphylococcus warneri]MCJ1786336.1 hypothetical protein [Staphylococcus warneri]MCJ1788730.1 hypothetical protein [Staphylococcus warneri]MCJ1791158.1 hypothetical protein [Staphylococcus warneri]MCJ1793617.1 hypothetical protein [Staphylococcus warneri]MCJ1796167.1 hypothetical protein [Staphylococcus warneri]
MTSQEFMDYYYQKFENAIDTLENDEESKNQYIQMINDGLGNESDELKEFMLKQLSINHAQNLAIVQIIEEMVVDE